jgi:hypothetical protein
MALTAYLSRTQALLQNPAAPSILYDPALLTIYINEARVQLAGESTAIKRLGSFAIVAGSQGPYPFSSIVLAPASGVQGVLNVRALWYVIGSGQVWFRPRSWPWFSLYHLNSAAPLPGQPTAWVQYAEGEAGTIYVGPPPDTAYTVNADCVCYPVALVDDTTPEAIPAPWTTAIPYYAAYLALLSAQTGARIQDAQRMFELYTLFVKRGREFSTPDILSMEYPQQPMTVSPLAQGAGKA